ncbi:uncharacterized protein LOC135696248 isoform X2 [Rhopilema esculentum]|uniref:uncharacterized protein LOC135696248 isoform X2 n=1 Tax=Rhopilema esculentum TaxID=499914 RepID=UPI0031CE5B0E
MAGRGRGSIMNEFLKGAVKENEGQTADPGTRESDGRYSSSSPLMSALAMKPPKSSMCSGGRGLMSPSQFVKTGSQAKEVNTDKTSAFLAAEEYLSKFSPYPDDDKHDSIEMKKEERKPIRNVIKQNSPQVRSPNVGPLKQITPQPTQQEKEEAEGEWQKYKFQRQIASMVGGATVEDVDEIFDALKIKLDDSSLSMKYPQFNEFQLILECLVDKSTTTDSFTEVSKSFIKRITDYDAIQFEVHFVPLISTKTTELVRVSASDKLITAGARRFCKLLGALYKLSLESDNDRLRTVIITCLEECIEKWTYPDGIGSQVEGFSVVKAEANALAATELFKEMDLLNLDKERLPAIFRDLRNIIVLLKESVLNECLPRKIREVFLDLLLAHIPRCLSPGKQDVDEDTTCCDIYPTDSTVDADFGADTASCSSSQSTSVSLSEEANLQLSSKIQSSCIEGKNSMTLAFEVDDSQSEDMMTNETSRYEEDIDDFDDAVLIEDDEVEEVTVDAVEREGTRGEDNVEHAGQSVDVKYEHFEERESTRENEKTIEKGQYDEIEQMMKELRLEDQVYRFKQNVIRDTVLQADKETLKGILKEASFPAGIVYEIVTYLDNRKISIRKTSQEEKKSTFQYGKGNDKHYNSTRLRSGGANFERGPAQIQGRFGTDSPSNRKLYGIGRGGNTSSDQFVPKNHKARRDNRDHLTGSWRQNHNTARERVRGREDPMNWRGRNDSRERENSSDVTLKNGHGETIERYQKQQFSNDVQEGRRIGKVEPQPRHGAEDTPVKASIPPSFSGFATGAMGCYRCGSNGHRSDECKNLAALFIG